MAISIFDNLIYIQLIGFLAVGFSILVFQVNKRENMLKLQVCASLLYAVHFYLLGAFTGSAMNVIGASRNIAYFKFINKKRSWLLPGVFMVIFGIGGIVSWQGPISILPALAMISGTLAFWQTNPKHIRLLSLVSPPLWFTYNVISGSYPGMIIEIIIISATLAGIYRYDIRQRQIET